MGQLAERVPVVQRKPQALAKRSPTGEPHPRSTARPQSGGAVAGRVASPVSEVVGGLPGRLRAGVEGLSGIAMDDVRVHRNSSEPAKLGALAFTRGTEIHLGPGQEQHLPHEAWHVVQQKEGRVRATTQMKGDAVNDDSRLEREADRMGDASLVHRGPPGPLRRAAVPLNPATQGKIDTRHAQKPWGPILPVFKRYDKDGHEYILSAYNSPSSIFIDLIRKDTKYLLGEEHHTGVWETEITPWPSVKKMSESVRMIPRDPSDVKGELVASPSQNPKPLESAHAALISILLALHGKLNDLCMPRANANWIMLKGHFQSLVDQSKDHIEEVATYIPIYKDWAALYDQSKLRNDSLNKTRKFATQLAGSAASIRVVRQLLIGFQTALGSTAGQRWLEDVRRQAKKLDDIRFFIPALTNPLLELAGIAGTPEVEPVKSLAAATFGKASFSAVAAATNPARERAMAYNIAAAQPPLLVQLGKNHLAPVVKTLASTRVVAVDLDAGERLSKYTLRIF